MMCIGESLGGCVEGRALYARDGRERARWATFFRSCSARMRRGMAALRSAPFGEMELLPEPRARSTGLAAAGASRPLAARATRGFTRPTVLKPAGASASARREPPFGAAHLVKKWLPPLTRATVRRSGRLRAPTTGDRLDGRQGHHAQEQGRSAAQIRPRLQRGYRRPRGGRGRRRRAQGVAPLAGPPRGPCRARQRDLSRPPAVLHLGRGRLLLFAAEGRHRGPRAKRRPRAASGRGFNGGLLVCRATPATFTVNTGHPHRTRLLRRHRASSARFLRRSHLV